MAWKLFGKTREKRIPDGLWTKCSDCESMIYKAKMDNLHQVCPECNYHFKMSSADRIELLLDENSFEEHFTDLAPDDPLKFEARSTYPEKLRQAAAATGMMDAAVVGTGAVDGRDVVFGVLDPFFIMGSMGSVVGEKIARGAELALERKCPYIFVSSSGGARMYEGALSLVQMSKTSAAIARLDEAGLPYVSILANPTTAGVMASFAALGDVILAEPKALIGFTGARVIQETTGMELPEGFQRAEFLLEHGFVDRIVSRKDMKAELSLLLAYMQAGTAAGATAGAGAAADGPSPPQASPRA